MIGWYFFALRTVSAVVIGLAVPPRHPWIVLAIATPVVAAFIVAEEVLRSKRERQGR